MTRDIPRDRHIVLIGLPGSGKTTAGRILAGRMNRPFVDLDEEVVNLAGKSVESIFRDHGEPHFRTLEAEVTAALAVREPSIVAAGGGWIANEAAVTEALADSIELVYLRVTPDTAARRLAGARAVRPLIQGRPARKALAELLNSRGPRYETAQYIVDAEAEPARIAERVLSAVSANA